MKIIRPMFRLSVFAGLAAAVPFPALAGTLSVPVPVIDPKASITIPAGILPADGLVPGADVAVTLDFTDFVTSKWFFWAFVYPNTLIEARTRITLDVGGHSVSTTTRAGYWWTGHGFYLEGVPGEGLGVAPYGHAPSDLHLVVPWSASARDIALRYEVEFSLPLDVGGYPPTHHGFTMAENLTFFDPASPQNVPAELAQIRFASVPEPGISLLCFGVISAPLLRRRRPY